MKKIFYLIFFASFFVIALSTFSSKALAGSCTISSGNTEDYEGLIVHVAVLDNKGNMNNTPPITGYTMNLTSNANGGKGGDAGIIRVNSSKAVKEGPYAGVQFSPVTSGCTDTSRVDSYNAGDMVLDYGTSSQNVSGIPSSPSNSSGWVLMCGTSTDPYSNNNDGRNFTMSMNGHPAGYADGGTWLYYFDGDTIPHVGSLTWNLANKSHGAINGLTMQFNAVYVEPPPPTAQIAGHVYSASPFTELNNVAVNNCAGSGGVTGSNNWYGSNPGWFGFTLNAGTGFCIRVPSVVKQNGHQYSSPVIKPWGSGGAQNASCGTNNSSYEYQVANNPSSSGACDYIPPKDNNNLGYDIAYQKDEVPQIQGVVYGHTTGSGKMGLPGISIPATHATPGNCTDGQPFAQSPTTDAAGNYTFKVGVDYYFCVHIPSTYLYAGVTYSNLVITPLSSSGISGNTGASCTAASSSYEWQLAELNKSATTSGANWCDYGLSSNRGYDFLYQKAQRADIAATTTVSGTPPPTSLSVSWTYCAADSGNCAFNGTKMVRFGAGTTYVTKIISGGTPCNNTVFGDPIYGTVKHCDISPIAPDGAYPGSKVTFTSTAADSNTLPDDGTDTYSYSVTPSTSAGSGDTTFGASCGTSGNVSSPLIPEATHTQSCTITIPTTSTAGTTYCITTTISNQPSYASVSGSPAQACVVVLQKPTVVVTGTLNGISSPSVEHEIGSASGVSMNVAISCSDFIGTISYSVTSLPSIYSSNPTYDCTAASPAVSNIPITFSAATLNANDPNTYVFTAAITAAAGVPDPLPSSTATLRNYTVPYARFYGNDIASGSGSIYFNNRDNQPLTASSSSAGSAAEYAAIAKTTILVATAAFSSTAPASPIGLSALTSAQVSIASTNSTSGAAWANNWSTSGYYGDFNATPTTISGASSIASKITIVGNDIYIKGNITIDESKLPYTVKPFNNALIPVITLIADHNIYIDPSVTQIDALLQAGNDIYTCSKGAVATPSAGCKNTLLVNGEVGAGKAIHFDRVCGTRLSATPTEDSTTAGTYMTNANPSCSGSYKSRVAAEVINFPSYLYFASPYISGATQTQYQSIYSAPPLL